MKAKVFAGFIGLVALVSTSVATAQDSGSDYRPGIPAFSPLLLQRHASTAQEGILRGWADVARARGEYNYNTSLALINREEAISRRLDNHNKFVQTYFQMRQLNQKNRYGDQASRPTTEDLARYSQQRVPGRLASYEYHESLGRLNWPMVLRQETFSAERVAIDRAIAARTLESSGVGSESYSQIVGLAAQMEAKLKQVVDTLSTAESIAARKFLSSLKYEVRIPLSLYPSELALR